MGLGRRRSGRRLAFTTNRLCFQEVKELGRLQQGGLCPRVRGTCGGRCEFMNRIALRDLLECAKSDDERAMLSLDSKPVQEHLAKLQMQLMRYQRKEGTFSMLSVQINAKTLAPAEWWHMYGKHLPELCSVAKRVLAQPVCASAAERNWSVYGQIKAAGSSRRNHSNADKRVFCHETLRMKVKLQSAGYTQAVEAWDPMDSDSDESDEEDYTKLMQ